MLLGYGAKVCLRKMRVKAENRMVTVDTDLTGSYRYHDVSFMGSFTFGLVFSDILLFFIACLDKLFRNTFYFYRYNLLLCFLEPVIECSVWNIVANAERVDGNSFGFAFGLVEEPQSFKIFFAKHNLSSFKFSTKVWERAMLVNTPILEVYQNLFR